MELLRTLRLADKATIVAKNLPYGDQRRLEIARALATEARRSSCSTSPPPA